MAHATRRDVARPAHSAPIRAKVLRRDSAPLSEQGPEERPEKRTTWRPPARQSGIQASGTPAFRPRADSGVCLGEEVIADLSKDPRHDG
jgi:hypothetical protein